METTLSTSEQKFLDVWKLHGIEDSVPASQWSHESLISPAGRKYIYDFAWPACRILIEIQGVGWGHTTPQAQARDAHKARVALEHGYIVIPVTTSCMSNEDKRQDLCHQITSIIQKMGAWENQILERYLRDLATKSTIELTQWDREMLEEAAEVITGPVAE